MPEEHGNIPPAFRHSDHDAGAVRPANEETAMNRIWSAALVMAAVPVALGGQTGTRMAAPMMGEKTSLTYTGCVASVNNGAELLLTHVAQDGHMAGHDGMHEAMSQGAGMEKKDDPVVSTDTDHMMPPPLELPASFVLTGPPSLKKHVGQTVAVTGTLSKRSVDAGMMDGGMKSERDTLTVGSLRVVGKTCG